MGDAAGEAACEGESDAGAVAGGALTKCEGSHAVGGVAQPFFGEGDLGLVGVFGVSGAGRIARPGLALIV